jgi:hypothetical protein
MSKGKTILTVKTKKTKRSQIKRITMIKMTKMRRSSMLSRQELTRGPTWMPLLVSMVSLWKFQVSMSRTPRYTLEKPTIMFR